MRNWMSGSKSKEIVFERAGIITIGCNLTAIGVGLMFLHWGTGLPEVWIGCKSLTAAALTRVAQPPPVRFS